MARFGANSLERLKTIDKRLRNVLTLAIQIYDFSIIHGVRGEAEQNRLFELGKSKKKYPNSKHNTIPSKAVDVAPYPIDWNDTDRFYVLAGIMKASAHINMTEIRWGGDWDSDDDLQDEKFRDLGHFELVH